MSGPRGTASWRRILIVATTATAMALLLLVATAGAHKRTFETTLQFKKPETVSSTVNTYEGRVISEKKRCVRDRKINVEAFDTRIAQAFSTFTGTWAVQGPRPPKGTTLVAFTPKKFLKKSKKHRHKCASDFAEKKAP